MIKLSPYAKMFYFEWLVHPDSARYNIPIIDELYGDLDVARLKQAVQRYIQDHLLLHSHIKNINGELHWVSNNAIVGLEYSEEPATDEELLPFINNLFDLHKDQLCRFKLIRMRSGVHRFVGVFQHIVMDGLSVQSGISDELSNYYNDERYVTTYSLDQQKEKLTELTQFYKDRLAGERDQHQTFWAQQLKDIEAIDLSFLKGNKKQHQQSCQARHSLTKQVQFTFDESVVSRLGHIKHQYAVSPYYFGFCVFAILLHRYTGHKKFAIAYPFGVKKGVDFIYGAQINTTLMPFQFHADTTVPELLNQMKDFVNLSKKGAVNHTEFPTTQLFNEHNKHLLQVVFNQTNFRRKTFRFKNVVQKSILDKFDIYLTNVLSVDQEEIDHVLRYQVNYDNVQMDEDLVLNFIDNFKRLFVKVLEDLENNIVHNPIQAYSVLMSDAHQHIVQNLNATQKSFSDNKTIHQCFEEQVLRTPNHVATIYQDKALTYAEINEQANQLAHYLVEEFRTRPDDLIALCLDRSEHMLIAALAVLKAGAAYVPLDPEFPDQRISWILQDTQAKALITNQKYLSKLWDLPNLEKRQIIALDDQSTAALLCTQAKANLPHQTKSHHLAYVIYTSGTTGKPKGVMLEHKGIVNRIQWMNNTFPLAENDRILQKTPYVFDVSVWELFWANWYGACVVFAEPKQHKDAAYLAATINKYQISVIHFTPSMLNIFEETISQDNQHNLLPSLKYIFCSGEALSLDAVKWCHQLLPNVKIHNLYGPTEASIDVLHFDCNDKELEAVYIGKPIDNTTVYVLDSHQFLLPMGAIGELYVGGVGLARGYLKCPELTKEKFVPNPFPPESSYDACPILYKTGDLARILPNGNVEYLGRNDTQIKIRGNRVELSEIESVLLTYPAVKQAVVVAKNSGKNTSSSSLYLVGYYVADQILDESELQRHLADYLPDYMVPCTLVHIETIPLTINGKLNQDALPEPFSTQTEHYLPAINNDQKVVCEAFSDVLNVKKIGINDDFFMLGGNSILAIKVTAQLQKRFKVLPSDIFKLKTPAKIAQSAVQSQTSLGEKKNQLIDFYTNKVIYGARDVEVDTQVNNIDLAGLYESIHQTKKINNVLLTGATGHLGCHVLNKLLTETNYKVYSLVREESDTLAFSRLNRKYKYYFDIDLNVYKDRVVVLAAEISEPNLGISSQSYELLTSQINSTIHCAALVKYCGPYEDFHEANILSTVNLLEFVKRTKEKDFHYVSTVGVLMDCHVPNESAHVFTEDDTLKTFVPGRNFYNQTKYKAEILTANSREFGVSANIYRVGNLGMNSETLQIQENISDNIFFSHFKTIVNMELIPKEIADVEISPVNCTASAIVKLFDKVKLSNQVHHVFNSHLCNLYKELLPFENINIEEGTLSEFIDLVLTKMQGDPSLMDTNIFLLYQIWLEESEGVHTTRVRISQTKTEAILNRLDFYWPRVTSKMLFPFLKPSMQSH